MTIVIIIIIFSVMTISGFLGVKKWKVIQKIRVEDNTIKEISNDKIKIIDYSTLNEKLQKVNSELNFEEIIKKQHVNGQYILDGVLFIKHSGIEKFSALIKDAVQNNYAQTLSKQEDSKLIKIKIKDLEIDEDLSEFIKKLRF